MAKRRRAAQSAKQSTFTHEEIYLNRHDEEKVLLFTAGLLLGVAIAISVLQNVFWYGWLSAVIVVLVLLFIETRQRQQGNN